MLLLDELRAELEDIRTSLNVYYRKKEIDSEQYENITGLMNNISEKLRTAEEAGQNKAADPELEAQADNFRVRYKSMLATAAMNKFLASHSGALQPSVSIIAVNEQGQILLAMQNGCNEWSWISGATAPSERLDAAAERILLEKAGLSAEWVKAAGMCSVPQSLGGTGGKGKAVSITAVFICYGCSGVLKEPHGDIAELSYFAPDSLPENVFVPVKNQLHANLR